ncbi:hypothetical protein CAEBREN_02314 [Caenorhabditis brenneri]|uniref:Uncharacterized protein n=1 Tax=Caenorhabditis brenneri TaxID=135651 RepID=G0N3F5_CAEBE|nr:hypothetical protein CAEBREN_02314 [Caenorhabditis brenneri]
MRLFILVAVLPALFNAIPIHFNDAGPLQLIKRDLTSDPTTFKEFSKFYVDLFIKMIKTKTRETFQAHMHYVDIEMMFNECNAPQYENYAAFANWLQQFVTFHDDPIVEIQELKGDSEKGEMLLNIDVQAQYKFRQNFDMKVSCLNDQGLGWKVLFVDRSIGCN